MNTLSYKTVSANDATVDKQWVIVDATDQHAGRLGSKVARILRGKHKPNFTPHVDCGDNVIIINAEKIVLTGNKWTDRVYYSWAGYVGNQKAITAEKLQEKGADRLVHRMVKGMLPKNRLGKVLQKNLYVYVGTEHKHEAQKPKKIDINTFK